jgi:hypothetical protein
LRVTKTQPRSYAVAASRPSITGSGSGTDSRAHVSAMAVSTGTIWSPYAVSRRVSQFSREAAFARSFRRARSAPIRISPMVRTLRKSSLPGTLSYQASTLLSGELLRSSETTFVSRR